MRTYSFFTLLALALTFCSGAASFAESESGEDAPRLLVHLLDYLSSDYGGAVENGVVKSENEYKEQIEFANKVVELNQDLPATKSLPQLNGQLHALHKLVSNKANKSAVTKLAQEIKFEVIKAAGIQQYPSVAPDLHAGRKSFEGNCAQCHGITGHGDGPAGKNLEPKPVNFHDGKRMAGLTPFQAFNAVRLGVPGTGMAGFPTMPDSEVWDLAYYVISLRHQTKVALGVPPISRLSLEDLSTRSDEEIFKSIPGESDVARNLELDRLRIDFSQISRGSSVSLAKLKLNEVLEDAQAGNWESAEKKALIAYLDGVEPIEPRLKARDFRLFNELELRMGRVRKSLDLRRPTEEVAKLVAEATETLNQSELVLADSAASPWFTFSMAAGIFLREAFEAVLLLIVLLGVVRSIGSKRAAVAVHTGWISALGVGLACWFFSGWILVLSGARREVLEGAISFLAVIVLLYMGFWLHRKTEIGRWTSFISGMAKTAVSGKSLFGLGVVAFMAVFREAFEIVLFMRALLLESGGQAQMPVLFGVLSSFVLVLALATALLKYSAKLPLRQLFDVSSLLMVFLAFTLTGKALHSFQESGLISVTELPVTLRFDLLGVYPTYETFVPQMVTLVLSLSFWVLGRKAPRVSRTAQTH